MSNIKTCFQVSSMTVSIKLLAICNHNAIKKESMLVAGTLLK